MIIERDWFHNERSYNAFLYAVNVTQKLEELRKKGAMIFDGDYLCPKDGQWLVELDGVNSFAGFRHENATQMYYGGSHDCESGKAWATMKEIKGFFADIRVTMPCDVKTVKDLM